VRVVPTGGRRGQTLEPSHRSADRAFLKTRSAGFPGPFRWRARRGAAPPLRAREAGFRARPRPRDSRSVAPRCERAAWLGASALPLRSCGRDQPRPV